MYFLLGLGFWYAKLTYLFLDQQFCVITQILFSSWSD
jgi:hypothetical protein